MKYRTSLVVFVTALCIVFGSANMVFANKSSVTIEAPTSAEKGSEIIIKINVSHSSNNVIHYTNWVQVSINEKEIGKWEFSAFGRPAAKNFSKEIKYTVNETVQVEAQANCNLHGSAGPANWVIAIK